MSEPQKWCVVLNGEGQHSIWWADRELPAGWRVEGTSGTRERCLARVQEVWVDPRPVRLRLRTALDGEGARPLVPELVHRQARVLPGAPAVEGDGFALSFALLDALSNRWARYLRSLGVGRGALVGVLLGRGAALHAVTLGVWRAGAGCLPLDPDTPAARLCALLADAGARVLVTELAYGPDGFDGIARYVDDPEVCRELSRLSDDPLDADLDPDDVAYVTQVPGVAGHPLAVAVTHGGLAHHVAWAERELNGAGDGGTAVFVSVACELVVTALWAPLCAGQRVLLAPQALDLADLGKWLAGRRPFAFLHLSPRHVALLVRQLGTFLVRELSVFLVPLGGASSSYRTAETSYGTDATPRVLDSACLPVPDGAVGELYVAGPGLARGYVGRAALTAQRFVPDPYGPPGARMFRTGELARRTAAGEVELLGRTDRQLWVRGHRADPAETEEALHDHPSVGEAVVIGVPAASDDVRLAAYVVPRPGVYGLDTAALVAHCARRLPGHLLPGSVTILAEVPRDVDGRVDRAALIGRVSPGKPSAERTKEPLAPLLAASLASHHAPGASVAVLDGGRVVAVEAAGWDGEGRPITPRTAFPVGELSRYAVALGALRLVDEGLLDEGVLALEPEAAAARAALPALLEEVTGEAFDPLMRRLVLGPLGMDDSCFGGPPSRTRGRVGSPAARVGHDAAGRALDGGAGRAAADPIELWTTAADLAELALEIRRSPLGECLPQLGGEAVMDGHYAAVVLHPEAGSGLVVLANGTAGRRVCEQFETRLSDLRHLADGLGTAGDGAYPDLPDSPGGSEVTGT